MGKPATQMAVAKSAEVAEIAAATIWDLAATMPVRSALDRSAQRQLRKLCRELCDVHDLPQREVLADVTEDAAAEHNRSSNGASNLYGGATEPAHTG